MAITIDDFNKIWASASPLTPYEFSDPNYSQGWNFVGSTPPARQMWDSIQKKNDEKFKFLRDNFGTPHIVTQASDMTDTDMVYVYMGSEAGWNSGHWYYYDEGTSSWADGGVYNSVAFVTDPTLSIAGQPADAKAVGDALALKADLAGCTFTGNVNVNADFSVTGDSTLTGNVSASGDVNATGDVTAYNISATTNGTIGGALSVAGASTLTGNVSAGADITVVGDVSSANIIASNNANIGGNATVTGSVASASLTTTADGTIGGNLSVSGTTALAGTSTAPTPSADDNSTKIATTEYVQTEIKPIETDVTINDKRITNIEKLLQGNLYDYQTDSTSAYTKSVPAGAMPYAGIESLGGKTVVWDQLADTTGLSSQTSSDVNITLNNNGSYTISGTASGRIQTNIVIKRFYSVVGHKYLVHLSQPFSDGGKLALCFASGFNTNVIDASSILECTTEANLYAYFDSLTNETGTTYSYTNVFIDIHDLTLMFGAGNEPSTVAEFESMFPASSYPYNEGTLLSAGVTEVESEGQNLINPANFTTNGVSFSDGVITIDVPNGRNYLDIYAGTTYGGTAVPVEYIPKLPFLMPGTYTVAMDSHIDGSFFVAYKVAEDGSVTTIESIAISGTTLTFDKPTRITLRSRYSSVITNLRLTKTASAVPYKPYFSATYPIPASIQALEGYGWSAGTAYNYIDFERKVFVQNVGRIVIDGSSISVVSNDYSQSNGKRFRTDVVVTNCNYQAMNTQAISSPIQYDFSNTISSYTTTTKDSVAIYSSNQIFIFLTNTSYTMDSLNTYLQSNPITIYYELATPVEVDISEYLTDDNLINVESGGTLTFPNSNGDDYRLPVPSEETYMIDLQSALGE